MKRLLRRYNNHTKYYNKTTQENKFNVSLCKDQYHLHYDIFDPYNGHEYVDLGLPSGTKWATMNICAENIIDSGLYFQWADNQGYDSTRIGNDPPNKKYFSWNDYKYSNNGKSTASDMLKYNSNDNKIILDKRDDAAHIYLGGNWYIPTNDQYNELLNSSNCSNIWTTITINDITVYGRLFTSKINHNTLFFPVTGRCQNGSLIDSTKGYYWTSTLNTSDIIKGRDFTFGSGGAMLSSEYRRYGFSIRAVID